MTEVDRAPMSIPSSRVEVAQSAGIGAFQLLLDDGTLRSCERAVMTRAMGCQPFVERAARRSATWRLLTKRMVEGARG